MRVRTDFVRICQSIDQLPGQFVKGRKQTVCCNGRNIAAGLKVRVAAHWNGIIKPVANAFLNASRFQQRLQIDIRGNRNIRTGATLDSRDVRSEGSEK
jgi:hypothetical protein